MSKTQLSAQTSSVSVFYEQLVQEFQRQELAHFANLEQAKQAREGKKKKKADMASAVSSTEKIRGWDEHTLETEELAKRLETIIKHDPKDSGYVGLDALQVQEKRKQYGPNALTERKRLPAIVQFLLMLTGLFNYMLWVGSALCFIVYGLQTDYTDKTNLWLAIIMIVVILVTGVLNYYQSSKTEELMAQFKNFIPPKATVYRNGKPQEVGAIELVPGDIVEVKLGDSVPADIVLIKTNEMKVNNASLTGESEEILRNPEEKVKNIFESKNVAFFGTSCTNGQGVGIVFKTGDSTVIGQIANLAQSAESGETPIAREIDRFIKIVASIAIFMGLFFFCINFAFGYTIITNISFMIGIVVANTPEGLIITVSVCMALAAKRMALRKVLVKNLQSVETLGCTSCICSDKTGTLTQNKMTVSHLYYNGQIVEAGVNYEHYLKNPDQFLGYDLEDPAFQELLQTVVLSTKASFNYQPTIDEIKQYIAKQKGHQPKDFTKYKITEQEQEEGRVAMIAAEQALPIENKATVGDASESGLIKFAQPIQELNEMRNKYPVFQFMDDGKLNEALIPFSSEIKFNMVVRDINPSVKHPVKKEENLMLYMKGAPERILSRCSQILINGEERPYSAYEDHVKFANDSFGKMGERVLAFARISLDPQIFTKDPQYPFDVKTWKEWKDVKERDENIPGWFPMWNLTLVGIVSLNDPPRVNVDRAVDQCRIAGIKVIMVTGDQPPTAAAIAHKVNIITNPKLEYNYLIQEEGMTPEDAWEKCQALVVHGDLLAQKHAEQEQLDDLDPEKGRFLIEWIKKPEVVFARTTPSQKLLIVDACQRAGHIVAVTGDGVNDSPAIKKADIGVAMGSGSDVAKNSADIVILNDDFSSIVTGVEEGRIMFDNLKKSISYGLSANIPEIAPVLTYIIFQIPPPLGSLLMLAICIGTDMWPCISLAYEAGELDIMERMPRNSKRDHLVTAKMMCFCYVQTGTIQAAAGHVVYFWVMNDYGMKFRTLIGLNLEQGYEPQNSDVYNPQLPNFGNSNYGKEEFHRGIQWGTIYDVRIDLRLFYSFKNRNDWTKCRWDPNDESIPKFWRISPISGSQICYTPESTFYCSAAYFLAIIVTQWANNLICKTRVMSIGQQQLKNGVQWGGLFFTLCFGIVICYAYPIAYGLQARPIACAHFAVPAMTFFTIILFYDEVRKILVRSGIDKSVKGKVKLNGWFARNTYY